MHADAADAKQKHMATPTPTSSRGKSIGFFLLIVGFLSYVVGFAPPYWVRTFNPLEGSWYSAGLWMTCIGKEGSETRCETTDLSVMPGWLRAVQVLQCLGMLGLALSCIQAVISCCRGSPSDARYVKTIATVGLSGFSGFLGVMVYVAKIDAAFRGSYSWAFGLNLTGSLLLMIASIVIIISHKMGKSASPGGGYQSGISGDNNLAMQDKSLSPSVGWISRPMPPYTPVGSGEVEGYTQKPLGSV